MKLIEKFSLSRMAGAALLIAAIAPVVAHADGLASARLDITSFQFVYNTNQVLISVDASVGNTSAATFNNLVGIPTLSPGQSISRVGPQNLLFNQNDQNTSSAMNGNYSGGFASQSGSGLVNGGGATALTAATVSLNPMGVAFNSSSGSNTVTQEFTVSVAAPGRANVGLTFNADLFLRSYLTAGSGVFLGGSSTSFTNWRLEVFRVGGGRIMEWTPSTTGTGFTQVCGVGAGAFINDCSQTAAFDLGQSVNAFRNNENDFRDTGIGAFSLNVSLLGGQDYRFGVTHISNANADLRIPEPGSLALIGLALVGAAVASRRRNA